MTVPSAASRVEFAGNGVTVAFTTPRFLANSHIVAYLVRDSDGLVTNWALTTNYTLTGAGAASGTLTAVVAPASGYTLVIARVVPLTQEYDYTTNDPFPAQSHENAIDLLTMEIQQVNTRVDRSFRFPDSDISGASLSLPSPVASYFFRWASDGLSIEYFDIGSSTLQIPADNSVATAKIQNEAVTVGKTHYTQTDVIGGRATAGAGAGEEIPFKTYARQIGAATSFSAIRTLLGLGALALKSLAAITDITMNTGRLLGRTTASAGAAEEITVGNGLSLASGALGMTTVMRNSAPKVVFRSSNTAITTDITGNMTFVSCTQDIVANTVKLRVNVSGCPALTASNFLVDFLLPGLGGYFVSHDGGARIDDDTIEVTLTYYDNALDAGLGTWFTPTVKIWISE